MSSRQHSHRGYIGLVTGLVLVLVAGLAVWASAANKGQIVDAADTKSGRAPTYQDFDSAYITFRYSGAYQAHKLEAKDLDLELSMLTVNTNYEKRLAVSVSQLAGRSLDSNSAYLLRKSQPEIYASRQVIIDGNVAVVSTKIDGLEQTVFIPHGDRVALLSFLTAGNFDDLQPEVDSLLKTFRWKG